MAGSYRHCTAEEDGVFKFDLIENMGDAEEACEQMHFMIQYLSGGDNLKIANAENAYYKYARKELPREQALNDKPQYDDIILEGMENASKTKLLHFLINVADRTTGSEVWRALFVEMLQNI